MLPLYDARNGHKLSCYRNAMCGTNRGYAATRPSSIALCCAYKWGYTPLRACDAMSGTDKVYSTSGLHAWYTTSNTD
eukprot:3940358-Rhodomonas_salina.3